MTLLPWPEPFDPSQQTLASYLGNVAELNYERARAEAALQRLRVAVDALKEIRSVHPLMHNGGNWDKFVNEVIEKIGEIPE
jgi:predicted transcriptional regulator